MWRLVETRGHLRLPQLSAQVDLMRPDLGLGELTLDGCPLQQAHLLHVRCANQLEIAPPRLQDRYLRGTDLIASYQHDDDRELTTQLYWRGVTVDSPAVGGVELIVSVQTSRLDSEPCVVIGSQLAIEEVLQLVDERAAEFRPVDLSTRAGEPPPLTGCGVLLHRLPTGNHSFVEMIHPGDSTRYAVIGTQSARDAARSQFHLFDEHLEKGVIRRGRLRGVFVPRQDDRALACLSFRRFIESALPLTA